MWPRKKFWWETGPGGTPPLQSPRNTILTETGTIEDDPMWNIQRDIQHPDVRIKRRAQSSPITVYPKTGPPGSGKVYPNTRPGFGDIRQVSQTPTAPFGGGIGKSAYQGVGSKKKGSMIKDIADALKDLDPGPDAPELAGGKFGRGMPAQLGFSLASMGGRLEEQQAMTQARREEELQRRRKLLAGVYA